MSKSVAELFTDLLKIMHRLRKECPWDQEQSLATLRAYLLEEAYECVGAMDEAIEQKNYAHLTEELGDVLLQVVFQSELLSELDPKLSIEQIIMGLNEKLVRRHPHVFGEQKVESAERALEQWDQIKRTENAQKDKSKTSFDSIARSLSALQRADKIGSRSKRLGFDWDTSSQVWDQFLSEVKELKEAGSKKEKEHELGDVLFSIIQWARHEELDSEVALSQTNERFLRRFKAMLRIRNLNEDEFKALSLSEKEDLWKLAKSQES